MFDAPEGMTIAAFTRHPVRRLLRDTAYGGTEPSKAELEALKLPARVRDTVRTRCRELVAIRAEGRHQDAWGQADAFAAAVIGSLAEELRDPDYCAATQDPTDGLGPAELAALVAARR